MDVSFGPATDSALRPDRRRMVRDIGRLVAAHTRSSVIEARLDVAAASDPRIGGLAHDGGVTLAPWVVDADDGSFAFIVAHEWTHLHQRAAGRVQGSGLVADPLLECEADRIGTAVTAELAGARVCRKTLAGLLEGTSAARPAVGRVSNVAQPIVVVFTNGHGQVDFIIQTSIDYGIKRCGQPVARWVDNPSLQGRAKVAVVGHGSPGKVEGVSADVIATRLCDPATGINFVTDRLIFTSCYAGVNVGGVPGTSVIDVVAARLKLYGHRGIEIWGAMGPSIKAAHRGLAFSVVDPNQVKQASAIQGSLLSTPSFNSLSGLNKPFSDLTDLKNDVSSTASQSAAFYDQFIDALDNAHLLLPNGSELRKIVV